MDRWWALEVRCVLVEIGHLSCRVISFVLWQVYQSDDDCRPRGSGSVGCSVVGHVTVAQQEQHLLLRRDSATSVRSTPLYESPQNRKVTQNGLKKSTRLPNVQFYIRSPEGLVCWWTVLHPTQSTFFACATLIGSSSMLGVLYLGGKMVEQGELTVRQNRLRYL